MAAAKSTTEGTGRKLYLVDGTAQLFRAYFAIRGLTNPDGLPTNAIFGFTSMLRKMLADEKPDAVAVAFDLPGDVFRHEEFPEYKANRPPAPEDLHAQVPYVKQVCEILGLTVVEQDRFEADDLIATYAEVGKGQGWAVTVVASDKDLLQLVEPRVEVLNPNKEQRLDTQGVVDEFGVLPGLVLDVQGLSGDTVDNIPGVPGVGGKTAVRMISTYGSLEEVISRAQAFRKMISARDLLLEAIDQADGAKPLQGHHSSALRDALNGFATAAGALATSEQDTEYRDRVVEAAEQIEQAAPKDLSAALGFPGRPAVKTLKSAKKFLKGLDKGSSKKAWLAVTDNAEQARMSKRIATLKRDVPLSVPIADLDVRPIRRKEAHTLFRSLGFRSLTKEFEGAADDAGGETPSPLPPEKSSTKAEARNTAKKKSSQDPPAAAKAATGGPKSKPKSKPGHAAGLWDAEPEQGQDRETDPATNQTEPDPFGEVEGDFATVRTVAALKDAVRGCKEAGRFAVDTETDSVDPMRARLVGISLSYEAGTGAYIPVGHDYDGAPKQLSVESVAKHLGPLLANPNVGKVGQNLIYDQHILRRHGMPVSGWVLDSMVAAFLLNASRSSYGMDSLAEEYLAYTPISYTAIAGKGAKQKTLNQIDIDKVTVYAAEDAEVTLRLADLLEARLKEAKLWELYETIDGPVLPLLAEMEAWGITVDAKMLGSMSEEMEISLAELRSRIHELAEGEFNVDSPKQLREVLFDRLGLKPRRKTAKSKVPSTDAQTLEELTEDHPIAAKLLEYRELAKLKSTYVDSLPRLIHPQTGRVHTSYHPTGAATGRLSSSDPNLQNIPARTDAGRRIRSAFVPEKGYGFLASDYSQVELRVLAHMADDEELIAAFQAGEDIHRYTAARVFGVDPKSVDKTMRTRAKAVNFGILYGMSETRLAREQGMTRDEARGFIEAYFDRFASVKDYIEGVRETALRDGAVRTLFGRVRMFPQLHQRVHRGIQEQALRAAVNTTIQGTAADLMKMAMLRVSERLKEKHPDARMLLQVHDELLLEIPRDQLDATAETVREAMEQVHPLKVPLAVDQKTGASWKAVT